MAPRKQPQPQQQQQDPEPKQPLSKSAQKKAAAAAKKAARKAAAAEARAQKEAAAAAAAGGAGAGADAGGADCAEGKYGDRPIEALCPKEWTREGAVPVGGARGGRDGFAIVSKLDAAWLGRASAAAGGEGAAAAGGEAGAGAGAGAAKDGSEGGAVIRVRARVHAKRGKGNLCFLVLRQNLATIQCVIKADGKNVSKKMVAYCQDLSKESIVDVVGEVRAAKVDSCSQKEVELAVQELFTVVASVPELPFQLEDAATSPAVIAENDAELAAIDEKIAAAEKALPEGSDASSAEAKALAALRAEREAIAAKVRRVGFSKRLDFRYLDLRVPAHQAVFRVSTQVQRAFRDFLLERNFMEIHTPKLIGGASEGGADVFDLQYFGKKAFLAQSPQIYKQMALACDFAPGVFEIGPVFRAENSNTHRHLCEFVGMDLEMVIKEHYHEAVDMLDQVFNAIFTATHERCKAELETIGAQYPFEPLKWTYPSLKLHWLEAIELRRAGGEGIEPEEIPEEKVYEDMDTPTEKKLGQLVKQKYGTDFFILDKFPLAIRPFYTMPCPENDKLSNSYDFFIRGQEILSGAQRVHIPELLRKRMGEKGVPVEDLQSYHDAFTFAAEPHAGGGIGLERVIFLTLGLHDIRFSSLFPRDPARILP